MSYTGTGTEADPYIVGSDTTCAEFISLVGTYNVYIEMQADIDFSTDDNYKRGITTILDVKCTKLYANSTKPDGSKYGINGLKITNNNCFIRSMNGTLTISNIKIVNCIYNSTSDAGAIFGGGGASYQLLFNDCVFSFVSNHYGYLKRITANNSYNSFNRCSIYISINGENNAIGSQQLTYGSPSPFNYSCIQIDNLIAYGQSTTYNWLFSNLAGCTVLCDLTLPDAPESMSSNVDGMFGLTNIYNSCFAIATHQGAPNSSGYRYTASFGLNEPYIYTLTIMDKSIVDTSDGVITLPAETGTFKLLTTQQMKDQSYLLSIGFLP